jgi:hypothetical protein
VSPDEFLKLAERYVGMFFEFDESARDGYLGGELYLCNCRADLEEFYKKHRFSSPEERLKALCAIMDVHYNHATTTENILRVAEAKALSKTWDVNHVPPEDGEDGLTRVITSRFMK